MPGLADSAQHIFTAARARRRGEPGWETTRMEWMPMRDAAALVAAGQISGASTAAPRPAPAGRSPGQASESRR